MAELNQLDTWLAQLQASTCPNKNFSNTLLPRPGQKAAQLCMKNNIKTFGTTLLLQTNSAVYPANTRKLKVVRA
jgi:hypothetical protein